MSFHKTNLGAFGENLPCSLSGYVPVEDDTFGESGCTFSETDFDFGTDGCGDQDWWEEFKGEAVRLTEEAEAELHEWQSAVEFVP